MREVRLFRLDDEDYRALRLNSIAMSNSIEVDEANAPECVRLAFEIWRSFSYKYGFDPETFTPAPQDKDKRFFLAMGETLCLNELTGIWE